MTEYGPAAASGGILYVVATPIGNLADISARAIEVLRAVDRIVAEDTRHSGRLLQHYAIQTPVSALHEHNEREIAAQLVARLCSGVSFAMISDAGTPLISDPGFRLVRLAREAGVRVIPVPGPSALVCALSASGLPTDRFIFEGFLPARSTARRARLEQLEQESRTMIFYESSHRIVECLRDMRDILGAERPAVMARELTKQFETIKDATLENLLHWVESDRNQQKGEIVLLAGGAVQAGAAVITPEAQHIMAVLLEDLPIKQAARLAARLTGLNKRALYDWALQQKG